LTVAAPKTATLKTTAANRNGFMMIRSSRAQSGAKSRPGESRLEATDLEAVDEYGIEQFWWSGHENGSPISVLSFCVKALMESRKKDAAPLEARYTIVGPRERLGQRLERLPHEQRATVVPKTIRRFCSE
jgi:hypothetical protein